MGTIQKRAASRQKSSQLTKIARETGLTRMQVARVLVKSAGLRKSAALGTSISRVGKGLGEMNPYLSSALLGSGIGAAGGAGYGAATSDDRLSGALRGAGVGALGGAAGGAGAYALAKQIAKIKNMKRVQDAMASGDYRRHISDSTGDAALAAELPPMTGTDRVLDAVGRISRGAESFEPGAQVGGALVRGGTRLAERGAQAARNVGARRTLEDAAANTGAAQMLAASKREGRGGLMDRGLSAIL